MSGAREPSDTVDEPSGRGMFIVITVLGFGIAAIVGETVRSRGGVDCLR